MHQSHAAVNYYNKNQRTWWAFKRRAQVGKPVSNKWGNAKNWYNNANQNMRLVVHQENLQCNQLQDIMDMSRVV